MAYWPWYIGGAALAAVCVFHWLTLRRMMAVSGRITAVINRLRFGPEKKVEMTADDLRAAMLKATLEAFGPDAGVAESPAEPAAKPQVKAGPTLTAPQGTGTHLLFLAGLLAGGLLSMLLAGGLGVSGGLRGEVFNGFFAGKTASALVLLGGGVLVGFGTRMAAGCTSGHGLCGVSRFQVGSLLATMAFFGTGVLTSFVLRWVL
ncbi:MAG: YeeE/YedE family protein [Myxococcales bacterium]|nr:YeeE/YedE family protein [Myxococcales bacterium]